MHELSIACTIFDAVLEEMKQRNLASIKKVGIRVGALTNVDPESLKFGFETIINDTPLAGSELEIENVPIKARCRACGNSFEAEELIFICPVCESRDNEVLQGQELDIVYLVGE